MPNQHDAVRNATLIGSGFLLGIMLTKGITMMVKGKRKNIFPNETTDDLSPPNSVCPSEGVSFDSKLCDSLQASYWLFLGTHWMNLDYYNKIMVHDSKDHKLVAYPVRLRKEAGFMRAWGMSGTAVGGQTVVGISPCGDGDDSTRAHDMVGILIPFSKREVKICNDGKHIEVLAWQQKSFSKFLTLAPVEFTKVDWLSAQEPPTNIDYVYVNYAQIPDQKPRLPLSYWKPPNFDKPILQSFVDLIVEEALQYGEDFAKEFLDQIQWWCNEDGSSFYLNDREQARRPWLHKPIASNIDKLLENHPRDVNIIAKRKYESIYGLHLIKGKDENSISKPLERPVPPLGIQRSQSKNFLFGFGSIINTKSRLDSDPKSRNAFACRIKAEFGYVREWNFQASTSKICALGLRKTFPNEKGATINGVLFSAPDDMTAFDQRENGYMRVRVPNDYVEILTSWNPLPKDAFVYIYVPYAPKVVAKYGKDPVTGLPRCSGPVPPKNLEQTEEAGLGLMPPSVDYPILQTYIDVCILGCLEYGEAFASEFIQTTFLWSRYWLNERELGRRPWLHQSRYVEIDNLLRQHLPQHFRCRKLPSEYALNFL